MKSEIVRHIFGSFLYILQTIVVFVLCQNQQIPDVNTPSYHSHKYSFATSYAWKSQFPIPYSGGGQGNHVQWRPGVLSNNQQQIQLPNEYLIASNYPASSVKEQQRRQQITSVDNQAKQQIIPNVSPMSANKLQLNVPSIQDQQQQIMTPTTDMTEEVAIQVPILNKQGQEIGWQLIPTKQVQQDNLDMTGQQPNQQSISYSTQSVTSGKQPSSFSVPDQQPVLQAPQIRPVILQGQQPLPQVVQSPQHVSLTKQDQQPQQSFPTQQGTQQSDTYPGTSHSFSSNAQNQDINRIWQTYHQNMLQALMSITQHPTYVGVQSSIDSNPPVAIASASITNDPNGNSHLNAFTYTDA